MRERALLIVILWTLLLPVVVGNNVIKLCYSLRGLRDCRPKDAKKFLDKYKRVDAAIDSYYNDPNQFGGASSRKTDSERVTKLNALFEKYKGLQG